MAAKKPKEITPVEPPVILEPEDELEVTKKVRKILQEPGLPGRRAILLELDLLLAKPQCIEMFHKALFAAWKEDPMDVLKRYIMPIMFKELDGSAMGITAKQVAEELKAMQDLVPSK